MAAETPTIVLVHGAWADATGFDAEIRALQRRGFRAIGFANPLRARGAGDQARAVHRPGRERGRRPLPRPRVVPRRLRRRRRPRDGRGAGRGAAAVRRSRVRSRAVGPAGVEDAAPAGWRGPAQEAGRPYKGKGAATNRSTCWRRSRASARAGLTTRSTSLASDRLEPPPPHHTVEKNNSHTAATKPAAATNHQGQPATSWVATPSIARPPPPSGRWPERESWCAAAAGPATARPVPPTIPAGHRRATRRCRRCRPCRTAGRLAWSAARAAQPEPVAQALCRPRAAEFEVPGATGHTRDLVPLGRPASRHCFTANRWARSEQEPPPHKPFPQQPEVSVCRRTVRTRRDKAVCAT
jgi:hypothetical protein